ncbi:hypothetical protein ONZ45_g2200 [Pleurotus djamor]|nr:hypothetical protein ONZ45_g2200 [Pleurotus djamor]
MPASRIFQRRRSSLGIFLGERRRSSIAPIKPGNYGIPPSTFRPVTFAPNVTPTTYLADDDDDDLLDPSSSNGSPTSALFPPSNPAALQESAGSVPARRRRAPPGKRRSLGYIPRPPNAFMLFRADFVKQKHVPGSIETNHGSLSKIIGNCWRALPLEEKRIWEVKAKHAKAEHKVLYPNYRFRPIHNKNKNKEKLATAASSVDSSKNSKQGVPAGNNTEEEERRCEEVAQLLLEGKKGEDLAEAVKAMDRMKSRMQAQVQAQSQARSHHHHAVSAQEISYLSQRRPSSVPLPLSGDWFPFPQNQNDGFGFAMPAIPSFAGSASASTRPPSPVYNISRSQRMMLGHRRASSVQLPAAAAYMNLNLNMAMQGAWNPSYPTDMSLPVTRDPSPLPDVDTSLFEPSFLDSTSTSFPSSSDCFTSPFSATDAHMSMALGPLDAIPPHDTAPSTSSSSSSPTPVLHAPLPVSAQAHATVFSDMWLTEQSFDSTPTPQRSVVDSTSYGTGFEGVADYAFNSGVGCGGAGAGTESVVGIDVDYGFMSTQQQQYDQYPFDHTIPTGWDGVTSWA